MPRVNLKMSFVIIIAVFAVTALNFEYPAAQDEHSGVTAAPAEKVDLTDVPDGTYRGEFNLKDELIYDVYVTIEAQQISRIEVDSEDLAFLKKPAELIERVIQAQSVEVDAVTGASASSMILLRAIKDALQKATAKAE
jgi:uncharacterized protein with FMN-binding domain